MDQVATSTQSLPRDWHSALALDAAKSPTAAALATVEGAVALARRSGKEIFPKPEAVYEALALTPFATVKAVILGQDPYHGPGQAHGLSFSVPTGERIPPSLRNIYKELQSDLGITPPKHGHLECWAKQGVLLLNAVLTVESGAAGSHAGLGWERFTDDVIRKLSATRTGLVFVLWGAHAQKKAGLIDGERHLVITSAHPSPLSAHRGFFGSRPFSRINEYLAQQGKEPIEWRVPDANRSTP